MTMTSQRFRFSLRTLLVIMAVMAMALGIWARRSSRQLARIRLLEGLHFSFVYDIDRSANTGSLHRLRCRLAESIGKHWIAVPVEAQAHGKAIYPGDLAKLSDLPSLQKLDLRFTTTDDECLAELSLPRLSLLNIDSTLATGSGLSRLAASPSLHNLHLGQTLITVDAANDFRAIHPQCKVTISGPLSSYSVESLRQDALRADRKPAVAEQAELSLATGILSTTDNMEKVNLARRFNAAWYKDWPAPDSDELRSLHQRIKNEPPDWGYPDEIVALGKLGHAEGIPALKRVAADPTVAEHLRCSAVASLSLIADQQVVPVLIGLLSDSSNQVARDANDRLCVMTRQSFPRQLKWDADPQSPSRRILIERWQAFWRENSEVLRLQRAFNGAIH